MQLPPPPARSFASDNSAGAHPAVLEAVAAANDGHALAYGADDWTRALRGSVRRAVRRRRHDAAHVQRHRRQHPRPARRCCGRRTRSICTAGAHIAVDETGAAERILGAKLHRPAGHRRQAHAGARSTPRRTCSATPTTSNPGWCRSPRAPNWAPCTRPTRSPPCATPPTGWG